MYQHLLVPIDGSATSGRGLAEAIRLAQALNARVTLLHVLDVYPFFGHSGWSGQLEADLAPRRAVAQDLLASAAAQVQDAGIAVSFVLKECLEPHAGAEIVRQARELKVDAIVMGTHGRRGISRMLLGGDAMIVLRDSPVPVLVLGPSEGAGSAEGSA